MEWRKVKNIIILVLLLLNGFLLVLVGTRREEALRYDQRALLQAAQVLEENGIQVDLSALTSASNLPPLSLERDAAQEARMMSAVLGETVEGDDRGGGLYLYRGQYGEVSVRLGGELSAVLEDDPFWQTDSPEDHAAGLLRQMGVDGELLRSVRQGGENSVVFRQLWNETPLFSCQITFTYQSGRLRTIQGNLLTSGATAEESENRLTLPTALLRFLEHVLESGDVCSSIQSMQAGYRAAQSFSSTTRLTPVWLISSDTASYYLDASTGALNRISD